jgi:hypothetical protein
MSILNAIRSCKFSSYRSIQEYAKNIWNLEPCKVIETLSDKHDKSPDKKVSFKEDEN